MGLNAGVRPKTIKDWTLDPVVQYGDKMSPTSKSIWDTLEDMDSPECIAKCAEIDAWRPLKKPKFNKVAKINPDSKGVNLLLKCVKAPEGETKEALCGDETGTLILSISSDAQLALCKAGAMLRVQHANVRMVKGFIRLIVDKWAAFKAAESVDFETVDESSKNNISSVEYELA